MFNQKIAATLAGTALAAAALGLVGVGTATTASAANVDDAFIAVLEDEGIQVNDADGAVELGQAICSDLDAGATPDEELQVLLDNTNLTDRQGAVFVVASISAYCPEHEDLLDA